MDRTLVRYSKMISKILRHRPEIIGITVDEHGWAEVDALIDGINRVRAPFNREMLEEIVRSNNKQRFSFSEDGTRIRANQGHSIPVDVELPVEVPPEVLYHGTDIETAEIIRSEGLKHMRRLYVHLSPDVETAIKVGSRHGKPFVFTVQARKMHEDGFVFYRSVNGVWLTERVPKEYLCG